MLYTALNSWFFINKNLVSVVGISIVFCFMSFGEILGQSRSSKKQGPVDLFGPVVGFNKLIHNGSKGDGSFRTLDDFRGPLTTSIGASYHRFHKRWSHLFQMRYASSKFSYHELRTRHVQVGGERILYQTEEGMTFLDFRSLNMVYMFGYRIIKSGNVFIYLGEQMGKYTVDKSRREVDVITYGSYTSVNHNIIYTPYPEPLMSPETFPEGFSYEFTAEIMARIDTQIKMSKKLSLIPSIEVAYDLHHTSLPYRFRIAGSIDLGYTL